ncbi:hypothetical protein Tco_0481250 [Tanacetum coccineum]
MSLGRRTSINKTKSSFVESSPNVDKETAFPVNKKVEFTKPENHENPIKKLVRNARRHMTENIAYLLDFKEFDGGYVAFGGGAYGGKITSKGTLKTDNLYFEDVYFVNELKFNLFSVSQMCDKKNYVLFTDTECLVLSPNFMLPDENQILLKIPRNDNMYNFDMKNIVPKESLTCLIAKATLEESMLWHRRLGLCQISCLQYVHVLDLKGKPTLGLWYYGDSPFELVAYTDSDYARATQDRKSTTGGCSGPRCQDTILGDVNAQTRFEINSKMSNNPPLLRGYTLGSGEDKVGEDSDIQLYSSQIPITDHHLHLPNPEDKTSMKDSETGGERFLNMRQSKRKDAQAKEIAALKKRIQSLERKRMSRPTGLKRLRKVGMSKRVESSKDQESLGDHEDASKQGRSIANLDKDDDVTLVDETQDRQDDDLMFDTEVLDADEMLVEAIVDEKDEQITKHDDSTAGEIVTTARVEGSAAPTTIKEITLAQTLIQIKEAKPKVVTTATTTITTTRPKVRGVVVQDPSEFRVPQETQPSSSKDKGKGIMIEPEVPLKRKDQISLDEQIARDIQAKLDAELIEEQKLARKQEGEANIALIESWENTQAMMEADRLLSKRLQSKQIEELTDEEKGKLFMELMEKRRKHFAALRAQEKRKRPPTKAQKRNHMSTYLKHMGGYIYKQVKGKSFDEIQKLFYKGMKRVNTFVAMGSKVQESKEKKVES